MKRYQKHNIFVQYYKKKLYFLYNGAAWFSNTNSKEQLFNDSKLFRKIIALFPGALISINFPPQFTDLSRAVVCPNS